MARALEVAEPRGMWDDEGGGGRAEMMGGVGAKALRDGIFAHPTPAEAFNNLFASV